ncbi:MAG TPA: hypothetical protein VK623_05525 [Flavobacterium sp.]|nr:hypothetical protein [Flavobacterium sp.]
MTEQIEHRLPVHLLEKSIRSGSEYGWRQNDFLDVIEAARKLQIAIEGGQIQYVFDEGTCELHWLHYYTDEMKSGENWANYCNRTAKECVEKFKKITGERNIEKEALDNFSLVKENSENGIILDNHKVFIISFEDKKPGTNANADNSASQRK